MSIDSISTDKGYHGISGAAREVGCAEDTLRALERRGVIHPQRDDAGRRLFTPADIEAARRHLHRSKAARRPPKGSGIGG